MSDPSPFRTSTPDFIDIANRALMSFLSELGTLKTSDRGYPYLLQNAAINLCMMAEDDQLSTLKLDDLVEAVKNGFRDIEFLLARTSGEERDDLIFSHKLFIANFEKPQVLPLL